MKSSEVLPFAYTDREIDIVNNARNIRDKFSYYRSSAGLESGLLMKDGSFLKDTNGRMIIELPASASQQGSPINLYLQYQIAAFKETLSKGESYPVKILFPYKLDAWHWNVGEIVIDANNKVTGCKYDSYGSVEALEGNMQEDIKTCLESCLGGASFDFNAQKQIIRSVQTGLACGLYAAIAMHNLKTKSVENIWDGVNEASMPKDEAQLRRDDYNLVRQHKPDYLDKFCVPLSDDSKIKKPEAQLIGYFDKSNPNETSLKISNWINDINASLDQSTRKKIIISLNKQNKNCIPTAAYNGVGLKVDKTEINGLGTVFEIKEIFSPEKQRFYNGNDSTVKIDKDAAQLLNGQYITAVIIGGKQRSIADLTKEDPTMGNIANIFHSQQDVKFVVCDKNGSNKQTIGCEAKENSIFVTEKCDDKVKEILNRDRVSGAAYNPEIHGLEVLGLGRNAERPGKSPKPLNSKNLNPHVVQI